MEIIALKGNQNSGKSTTLNILYQYLLLFGYNQIPTHFEVLNAGQKDFKDIVEKKGIKIGIATMGDYQRTTKNPIYSIENFIDYFVVNGCDKVICAVNINRQSAIAYISTFKHTFVDKSVTLLDSEERIKNGEDAERIYKLV